MIEFSSATHAGNRQDQNQDSNKDRNEDAIGWSEASGLYFVADGIGGHVRGNSASAIVKQTLLKVSDELTRTPSELVLLAHEAVLLEGIEQSVTDMSSTLVLARVDEDQLAIAWCGDSRAYLWRHGELVPLTRDHSRGDDLDQTLGLDGPHPRPGELSLTLADEDIVLLCSDGLHDELPDTAIADVLRAAAPDPQSAVNELEQRMLARQSRDNFSVICLRASNLIHAAARPLEVSALRSAVQTAHQAPSDAGGSPPASSSEFNSSEVSSGEVAGENVRAEPAEPAERSLKALWLVLAAVIALGCLILFFG